MLRIRTILITLLGFFIVPVFAAVNPAPYYIDATIGHAQPFGSKNYDASQVPGTPQELLWGGIGGSVEVGKMLNKQIGVEAGFSHFNSDDFNYLTPAMHDINTTIMNNTVEVDVKGLLPLWSSRASLFGKIGPAVVFSSSIYTDNADLSTRTQEALALYGALGVNYAFDEGRWNILEQFSAVSNSAGPAVAPGLKNRPALWMMSFGVGYAFV